MILIKIKTYLITVLNKHTLAVNDVDQNQDLFNHSVE